MLWLYSKQTFHFFPFLDTRFLVISPLREEDVPYTLFGTVNSTTLSGCVERR